VYRYLKPATSTAIPATADIVIIASEITGVSLAGGVGKRAHVIELETESGESVTPVAVVPSKCSSVAGHPRCAKIT
jgi:hypothetical protein